MGSSSSSANDEPFSDYYIWRVPIPEEDLGDYAISPQFQQEKENYVAYLNRQLCTVYIYCCSALQWHFDESFMFRIEMRLDPKNKKKIINRIETSACMTRKHPFVAITIKKIPDYIAIKINLPKEYPNIRNDPYIGIRNAGSTCYIASLLQVLYNISAFRQLIFSFRDPPPIEAALQNMFVDLQFSSRPLSIASFIGCLGPVADLAAGQEDVHEFLLSLFDRLETDLGSQFTKTLNSLFSARVHRRIVHNKKISEIDDLYLTIPITVDGQKDLREVLKQMSKVETLSDYEGGTAQQTSKFQKLSPFLIFQLCRFKYDKVTNSVVELKNPFKCPKKLLMNKIKYELFAVIAHSGTPTCGHYVSYIRPGSGKKWYLFDDNNVFPLASSEVNRTFSGNASMFRLTSFGAPLAYLVFYLKAGNKHLINGDDSIPLYLAPHKTNKFYSKFMFYEDIKNLSETENIREMFEWENPKDTLYRIARKINPHADFIGVSGWALLPGRSQFIGPLPLDCPAAQFVIRGHPTKFFILPKNLDPGPIFVVTNKPPRKCVEVCLPHNIPVYNGFKPLFQLKPIEYDIMPGSFVVLTPSSPLDIRISQFKLDGIKRGTLYSEIQKEIANMAEEMPQKIIFFNDNEPMKIKHYQYANTFPKNDLSYQVLLGSVTACSLSMFTPLTFVLVTTRYVRQLNMPIWYKKGVTCSDLSKSAAHHFQELKVFKKMTLLCSRGDSTIIRKVLRNSYCPKNEKIRLDLIRYEIPTNRRRLNEMINSKLPMSMEVRLTTDNTLTTYVGTSRLISITKQMTGRDIINKMKNYQLIQGIITSSFFFVHEKPKIKFEILLDELLYSQLDIMYPMLSMLKQRVCIALVVDNRIQEIKPNISRSLSATLRTQKSNF